LNKLIGFSSQKLIKEIGGGGGLKIGLKSYFCSESIMKTTKTRLFNIVIACSIAINLTIVSTLCYIASVNSKIDRFSVAMTSPVLIYAPKTSTSPSAVVSVETPLAK
jgi:hypothetical protein